MECSQACLQECKDPQKPIKKRSKEKINKIKKIDQNYQNAVDYLWVKSDEFLRG